jgi:hypothetical protein
MKRLFVPLLLASACFAQTAMTITVTVTIPAPAAPLATAWVASQCATLNADGTCATQQYADVATAVKAFIATALNQQALVAAQWAVNKQDASLPAPVLAAITGAQAAGVAINATATATAMGQAYPITVQ